MNDAILLDEIKVGFGLKNDSEIAGFLGVTRTAIHNVRYKGRKLGVKSKFQLLDRIAFLRTIDSVETWAEKLTTTSLSRKIRSKNQELARKRALRNLPSDANEVAEKDLIEEAKIAFACSTDQELAEILGVARNTISAIRSGSTSLGPEPRLRILYRIEPFDIDYLHKVLSSTDEMIELIRHWAANRGQSETDKQP